MDLCLYVGQRIKTALYYGAYTAQLYNQMRKFRFSVHIHMYKKNLIGVQTWAGCNCLRILELTGFSTRSIWLCQFIYTFFSVQLQHI